MSAKHRRTREALAKLSPEARAELSAKARGFLRQGAGVIATLAMHDVSGRTKAEALALPTGKAIAEAHDLGLAAWEARLASMLRASLEGASKLSPVFALPVDFATLYRGASALADKARQVKPHTGRINHWLWVVRPVRKPDTTDETRRTRDYSDRLGFASARGSWRYRAGAERGKVQGGTDRMAITVEWNGAGYLQAVPFKHPERHDPITGERIDGKANCKPELIGVAGGACSEHVDYSRYGRKASRGISPLGRTERGRTIVQDGQAYQDGASGLLE